MTHTIDPIDSVVAGPLRQRDGPAARAVHAVKVCGRGPTEVRALDDVTVSFERGHLTAIMGPSGSGKSTLLHCLVGLDTLTSGQVFVGGTDLTTLNERELTRLRRERIGFVFQSFNLVPTLTAGENITLPLALAKTRPDAEWFERAVAAVLNALASEVGPAVTGRLKSHLPADVAAWLAPEGDGLVAALTDDAATFYERVATAGAMPERHVPWVSAGVLRTLRTLLPGDATAIAGALPPAIAHNWADACFETKGG